MIAAGTVGHFMTVHPSLDYQNKVKVFLGFVVIAILVAIVSYLIFFSVNSAPVNHAFGPSTKVTRPPIFSFLSVVFRLYR